jgi:hypothetical protein
VESGVQLDAEAEEGNLVLDLGVGKDCLPN